MFNINGMEAMSIGQEKRFLERKGQENRIKELEGRLMRYLMLVGRLQDRWAEGDEAVRLELRERLYELEDGTRDLLNNKDSK